MLDERSGFVYLLRAPVAEIEAKEVIEHRFNATIVEFTRWASMYLATVAFLAVSFCVSSAGGCAQAQKKTHLRYS
jgi:hypothetical protein